MPSTWGPERALGKRKFHTRTAHLKMHTEACVPNSIAKQAGFPSQGLSSCSLNVFFRSGMLENFFLK